MQKLYVALNLYLFCFVNIFIAGAVSAKSQERVKLVFITPKEQSDQLFPFQIIKASL